MVNLKKRVVPSIIAKNQRELKERISKVSSAKILQLDIMDGKFVPNSSLNFNFRLPKKHHYEAHLMIKNPGKWIKNNYNKAGTIIVHFESTRNHEELNKIIKFLRVKRKKVGLAIRPETETKDIVGYLDFIDEILVMAVKPGRYGAKFLPKTMKKVRQIRRLSPKIDIEVDGGIMPKTISRVKKAGANLFICGSYLQQSDDPQKAIRTLERLIH